MDITPYHNCLDILNETAMQIKKAVDESKDRSFSELVTDLVLKRELIKVVFSKQYSK